MVDQPLVLPQNVVEYIRSVFRDESATPINLPPGAFSVKDALEVAKQENPKANRDQVYQTLERRVARGELRKRIIQAREKAGRRVVDQAYYWRPTPEELASESSQPIDSGATL